MIDAGYTTLSSHDLRMVLRGSSPKRRLAIWREMPLMFQLGEITDTQELIEMELRCQPWRPAITRELIADLKMLLAIHRDAESMEHDDDRAS